MRNAEDVARRALCLELITQRVAIESQAEELPPDDAKEMVEGLGAMVDALGLASSLAGKELDHLRAPVGKLDLDDPALDASFADLMILLWSIGRLAELPTVTMMQEQMGDFLTRGILAEAAGDMDSCAALLDSAKLRSDDEIATVLGNAAKANAMASMASAEPAMDIPPATVFYVLPWLMDASWPWGQAGALHAADGDITFRVTPDGIDVSKLS